MPEFELKFHVDDAAFAGVERAVLRAKVRRGRLQAIYFDTAGRALAKAHVALRLRKEGRLWVQTAKARGKGPVARLEHNVALGVHEPAAVDPALHAGSAVHEPLQRALAEAHEPLAEIFRTDVRRTTRVVRAAGAEIEIALDRGSVKAAGRTAPISEIEFELLHGRETVLIELARRWREQHGLWLDSVSKAERGHRLAQGRAFGEPATAQPMSFEAEADGGALLAAVVAGCVEQALDNASDIAAGSTDDEHVHQMRVGLRRLRTALRELSPLAAGVDPAWQPALAQAFRALGQHRDRAAMAPALQQRMQADGAPALAWPGELPPPHTPATVVRGGALQDTLLAVLAFVHAPAQEALGPARVRSVIRKRLAALHRKAVAGGRRFAQLPPAEQHRVRKQLKRLRYLAELVRPLFAARQVDAFVRHLKPAQDALGEYQDLVVAQALWRERALHEPAALFGVGWLAARRPPLAGACQAVCEKDLSKVKRFWHPS